MNLTTKISFPSFDQPLSAESKTLFLGSCFADEIGAKMKRLHLDTSANLLGITYNPFSIAKLLDRALKNRSFEASETQWNGSTYVHTDLHSKFNASDEDILLSLANDRLSTLSIELETVDYMVITLGTSIVFEDVKGEIVNNCHKLPSNLFNKRTLTTNEMYEPLLNVLKELKAKNSKLRVLLTVSPIRHLRHGGIENMRSKARLLLVCEDLCKQLNFCTYFPIFEFVMDELRDYRFYNQRDLIHLNDAAIDLIFEKFKTHSFSPELIGFAERIEKWNRMLNHRLENTESKGAAEFLEKIKAVGQNLQNNSSGQLKINIQKALTAFENGLKS